MVNNNDDDGDDNSKLPPAPTYCEQPSQVEGVVDEAVANSDPFVDKANDHWRTGHMIPAKNPMGMTYDNEGTKRLIVYNNKGIDIRPPRMREGYRQRCGMALYLLIGMEEGNDCSHNISSSLVIVVVQSIISC